MPSPRVLALSDLHLDYRENQAKFDAVLAAGGRPGDALILAGDLTHDLGLLEDALAGAAARFDTLFYVPGNHELWLRGGSASDSLERFNEILQLCLRLGVHTAPHRLGDGDAAVWVVPLFSWYTKPEEGSGEDSLYSPKPGEDPTLSMWSDDRLVRWPDLTAVNSGRARTPAELFLMMNETRVRHPYDAPVVSFSHFLPRQDLIFRDAEEKQKQGPVVDRSPAFNFSRVAGSRGLDAQIRALGSVVHVYGHQHRNRNRLVDGVTYVSHCLGYPEEYGHHHEPAMDWPMAVWGGNGGGT